MPSVGAGNLRERLVLLTNAAAAATVATLTASGTTATATCRAPHGFVSGDYVTVAGAAPVGYNLSAKVTVTSPLAFTYAVAAGLSSPATGAITATYVSDAQGGRHSAWRTVATVAAELVPIRATERLQFAALQRVVDYRFRVRRRDDLTAGMRAYWTPSGCASVAARKTLVLTGVLPVEDGRTWLWVEGTEA